MRTAPSTPWRVFVVFRYLPLLVVSTACLIAAPLTSQSPPPPPKTSISFRAVPRETIEERLDRVARKNEDRHKTLRELFEQAGCAAGQLSDQAVRRAKIPNVSCILPGSTDATILIGAHFDHSGHGTGVIDNWSGAALLPSLFETLNREPRKHTFVFVGFTEEEKGLVGSSFYAKQMTPEQVARIKVMVNIDSIGLGPTKVWLSRSDSGLPAGLQAVAKALNLGLQAIDADQVGDEDSRPFHNRKIRTLVLHSITQDTLPILHSSKDKKEALKINDYVDSYRLVAAYLVFLDTALDSKLD